MKTWFGLSLSGAGDRKKLLTGNQQMQNMFFSSFFLSYLPLDTDAQDTGISGDQIQTLVLYDGLAAADGELQFQHIAFPHGITAFDVAAVAFDELTDVFLHFGCIRDADAELLRHKGVVAHGETIAEVAHMPAAVVRPLIDEEFRSRKITPAPRKEMPLTTCVAIRPGLELRPAIPKSTRSTKQYFDRIMITADVTAMMQCVRIPASFWRLERSSPMRKPNSSTTRIRMRNSRLSPTVSTASGR